MGVGQRLKVACDDGFEVISTKEHELVQHVQIHLKDLHQKILSHEEVMKMAKKL
jgi:predicted small metal-binding protein